MISSSFLRLSHVHITIPLFSPFYAMVAVSKDSIWRSDAQLVAKRPCVESSSTNAALASTPSSSSTPPSSSSGAKVFLAAIMDQLQLMHVDFGSCLDHFSDEIC